MLYFLYRNNSESGTKIGENVEVKGKNLKICPPFTKNNSFYVSVGPGGEILVLIKIMSINHSYQLGFNFVAQNNTEIEESEAVSANNVIQYQYIDDPKNKYPVEINNVFNQYLRQRTVDPEVFRTKSVPSEEKPKEVEEVKEVKEVKEDNRSPLRSRETAKSTAPGKDGKEQVKPPKRYPEIQLAYGQIISKKIPFVNYGKKEKLVRVVSTNPEMVYVKNPENPVSPNDSVDIRLRFMAPEKEGKYEAIVEIFSNESEKAEEVLIFTLDANGAYHIDV